MKIILVAINAKYIHSNLAVYSLKAYADRIADNKTDIIIKEYTINQNTEWILNDIYTEKADLIAFSSYIWNIEIIYDLINNFRKINQNTDIWLGGPEVAYRADEVLEQLDITGILLGEGEIPFSFLVREYQKIHPSFSNIPGIAMKGLKTEVPELIAMDELPFVYESILTKDFDNRIPYYETMRGCPFSCSYCLSSIDKRVRFRSMDLVKKELQFFLDNKVKQVKFVDRTFNCKEEHALEIWKYIVEHDNGISNFHFEVAADVMTEKELDLIKKMRPGLIQLEVGVQSTNKETIKAINRIMDFDKVAKVSKAIISNNNIHLHLDLIAGLPKEDYNSFKISFNQVYSLKPHELQLGFLKVLSGTKIEPLAKDGHIAYWDKPPYEVLFTDWLSYEEVRKLKNIEEMLEIYYNSNQFIHSVAYIEAFFDTAFDFYEALADYYEKNGHLIIQSSRIKKYDILLEFANNLNSENNNPSINISMLKEALLIDLYSRENLKKQPDFAKEIPKEYLNKIHDFYLKEMEKPEYLTSGYEGFDLKQLMKQTHIEIVEYLFDDKRILLFDYSKKDPISGNIYYYDISEYIL